MRSGKLTSMLQDASFYRLVHCRYRGKFEVMHFMIIQHAMRKTCTDQFNFFISAETDERKVEHSSFVFCRAYIGFFSEQICLLIIS